MKSINIDNIICIRVRTHKGLPLNDFQIKYISKKYSIDYFFLKSLVYTTDHTWNKKGYLKVWLLRNESFGYELIAFTEFVVLENCPKELYLYHRDIVQHFMPYGDIIRSMNFDLNEIKPIDFPPFTEEKVLTPEQTENKINSILDKINDKVKETGITVNEAKEFLSKKEKNFLKKISKK